MKKLNQAIVVIGVAVISLGLSTIAHILGSQHHPQYDCRCPDSKPVMCDGEFCGCTGDPTNYRG